MSGWAAGTHVNLQLPVLLVAAFLLPDTLVVARQSLEEKLGVEEASYLMDRPVGGWSDLVTNQSLDLRFQAFRHELLADMERRFRTQTWALVTTILASVGFLGVMQRI